MNEGPLPEAQKLDDFPWTVENLVVPTAKSGNSIVALALYGEGQKEPVLSFGANMVTFGCIAGLKIRAELDGVLSVFQAFQTLVCTLHVFKLPFD